MSTEHDAKTLAEGDQWLANLRAPVKVIAGFYRLCREEGLYGQIGMQLTLRFAANLAPAVFVEPVPPMIVQPRLPGEDDE